MIKRTSHNSKAVSTLLVEWLSVFSFQMPEFTISLNEEGKLLGLPVNEKASELRRHLQKISMHFHDDFVVGPAILIKKYALNTWAN
jgi:hypothetical protein